MNVLAISPQPFFSPRGTPLSVYYRTLVTAEMGANVDLLTYGQGQDVDIPGVRIIRIPRFKFLGDVRVGPSYLKLFLDVVLLIRMVGLLLTRRYDVVHAHEEAVFFCVLLRPVFRFRFIYDMHSSLPQQLKQFQFTRSKVLMRIFEGLERRALIGATAVITICRDLYEYANTIATTDKNVLIENSLFDPVKISDAHQENMPLDIPTDKRLIVYAGTLEPYQGIDLLLQAFRFMSTEIDDVLLVVAGGTPAQVQKYGAAAVELGIGEKALFVGSIPRSHAAALNARASVVVSPRLSGGNTPLKIYEQLASGIPLVATDVYSHTQVLDHTVAFLAAPEVHSFAAAIIAALTDSAESRVRVTKARELYAQTYSRDSYERKMSQIFDLVT